MIYDYKGAHIYYEEIGEGKPILMLHGFPCDHRVMSGCMEPIFQREPDFKRIYVDLPGMGKSDAARELQSSDAILEVLLNFASDCIEGDFLLAGESYGGYLAQGILARIPERISGMLLLCPVTIPQHEWRALPQQIAKGFDNAFPEEVRTGAAAGFCEFAVVANPYTYSRYQAEFEHGARTVSAAFAEGLEHDYAFSFDVIKENRENFFGGPVLMITGRQDTCVGYADIWKIVEDYPRATFAVLDMAGHYLQIEQPQLFEALVREWILRVKEEI